MDEISLSPAKRLKCAEGKDLRDIRSAENCSGIRSADIFSGVVEKEERRIIQLKGSNQLETSEAGEEDIRKRSGKFLPLFKVLLYYM